MITACIFHSQRIRKWVLSPYNLLIYSTAIAVEGTRYRMAANSNQLRLSLSYIQIPLLLNPSINPPACMPTHFPNISSPPRTFSPSSNLLVKNSSVSMNPFDLSCVMNNSALAYRVASAARLVYQDEVTVVLPARKRSSSDRRASSRIEVGRWRAVERRARASCQRWIMGLLACSLWSARVAILAVMFICGWREEACLARARRWVTRWYLTIEKAPVGKRLVEMSR